MSILNSIHDSHLGCITAYTGAVINFKEPEKSDIRLEDLAHGMAFTCRFGGHVSHFYSVAQHSVLVYNLAPEPLKKAALFHDAQEAYLGDVVTPLKKILGNVYKDLEEQFQFIISHQFNVDRSLYTDIKYYDRLALAMEARALKEEDSRLLQDWFHAYKTTLYWTPSTAKYLWMAEVKNYL